MSNVSNDLIWELTKNQSSFLVKRSGLVLSADPLNLTGNNSKASSGLANDNAVGVAHQNGKVVFKAKIAKNANKPNKAVHTVAFHQHKPSTRVALAVSNAVKGYKDEHRVTAVKKASQLTRARSTKKEYTEKSRK